MKGLLFGADVFARPYVSQMRFGWDDHIVTCDNFNGNSDQKLDRGSRLWSIRITNTI